MFEISWSELLILAIVTLIFVGPKELPVFLRTLGRYAGTIKRQANEFRAQFDAAMREAELDSIKKEVEALQASVNTEVMGAKAALDSASSATSVPEPLLHPAPPQLIANTTNPPMPALPGAEH